MVKCAKISLSKLSLWREFKTLRQFSFACFKFLDSFSSKSHPETLQHEVLPDNCQLKNFEICCIKLLLRTLAAFLFKWTLLLFRWLALISFLWPMRKKFFLLHISFKWWLTLLPFLFNSSSEAKSVMVFAILSGGLFEFKSFVPTWSIRWFGFARNEDFM